MEVLDPGCDGKLLASKLADDEIPQERYEKLKEFVERLEEFGEEGFDEATMRNNFVEDHAEDDIEVYICLVSLYGLVEVMQFKPTIESDIL